MSFLVKAMTQAAAGAGGVEKDEYFNQTTLLLHGDGNQGANNFSNAGPPSYLAFSDNSDNDFPITVNGDAYGTPFSPYSLSDGNWSNYFDGSGDELSTPDNAAFELGSSDFCIEAWVYMLSQGSSASNKTLIAHRNSSTTGYRLRFNGDEFDLQYNATTFTTSGADIPLNTWTHVAVIGTSTDIFFYKNGVQVGNIGSRPTIANDSGNVTIGGIGTQYFDGYISNLRLVLGDSVYNTAGFTPPTSPLTNITNTSLLTCQSNRFIDNSSNAFALTPAGDVAVKTLNPFNATIDGTTGSGYFDGSGDYLVIGSSGTAAQLGTGDFCAEAWFYSGSTATQYIFNNFNGSGSADTQWAMYDQTSEFRFGGWYTNFLIGTKPPRNQWNHVVVCRASGTMSLFINGVREATSTTVRNLSASNNMQIGAHTGSTSPFNGYITQTRLVKGDSVYDPTQTTLTVPTAPLTAITNTELLTCQYQGTVRNVGFIDSSPNNFPITRNGNTTQGTFSPFSNADGEWSVYIGGVDDWVDVRDSGALLGSGAWTMEGWFYPTTTGVQRQLFDFRYPDGYSPDDNMAVIFSAANAVEYWNGSTRISGGTVAPNQWNHVLCSRDGANDVRLFLNGVQIGSAYNDTTAYDSIVCRIGCANTGGDFQGYVSNVRLVNGSAVQTSGFTVPTSPLTDISGTTFLGLQSNRFVDNSATPVTSVTPNDAVSIQPFSPFAPSAAYSPSVNGGSGYFDGTGDYLITQSSSDLNIGSGDFTIEGFFYKFGTANDYLVEPRAVSRFSVFSRTMQVNVYDGSYYPSGITFNQNEWVHFAVVRSGSTVTIYQNGQAGNSYTIATDISSSYFNIGANLTPGAYWEGYMSDVRVVVGRAVYSGATYTIPTAPLTATSGGDNPPQGTETKLLLNFTNAGILDNTGKNSLETVGNAQVDTATKKYGTGSMEFDGTGDYLLIPNTESLNLGTGDFTMEFWVYVNAGTSGFRGLIAKQTTLTTNEWRMAFTNGTYTPNLYIFNGTKSINAPTVSTGTWTHIAFVRSNGTVTGYTDGIAGTPVASVTGTLSNTAPFYIGSNKGVYLNGYIDDLRITKGVARYTSNFTVPDKAFPDL